MSPAEIRAAAWLTLSAVAVLLCIVLFLVGTTPWAVVGAIVERAVLSPSGLLEASLRTIPLTIMGLGIALAFRARVFNIGMDGQLIAGSVLAVAAAPLLPLNGVGLILFLLLGLVGGALWGGIAGVIKARLGGNEIIATIMLNYVAIQILSWLVRGPLQEKMRIIPRTDAIDGALRLGGLVEGSRLHLGLLVALAAVVVVTVAVKRLRFGFRIDVVGLNSSAAHYAGLRPAAAAGIVLAISGALAGLAGVVEISGVYGRLQEGFAPGFGIAAIAVALVARLNPLFVPVSAAGFSLVYVGLGALARNGSVPFPVINIIEGCIILLVLAAGLTSKQKALANG